MEQRSILRKCVVVVKNFIFKRGWQMMESAKGSINEEEIGLLEENFYSFFVERIPIV